MRKFALLKWCQSHWDSELSFTNGVVEVVYFLTICKNSKQTLEPNHKGSNPSSAIYQLRDPGQGASSFWASFLIWKMVMPVVPTLKKTLVAFRKPHNFFLPKKLLGAG